jgi:predicted small metal-binding protein
MMMVIDCALVEPAWGCRHRIRAATEAEAMRLAAMHARSHGSTPTPALIARSRDLLRVENEPPSAVQQAARAVATRPRPRCLSGTIRLGRRPARR